jgi:hypothetical protein
VDEVGDVVLYDHIGIFGVCRDNGEYEWHVGQELVMTKVLEGDSCHCQAQP